MQPLILTHTHTHTHAFLEALTNENSLFLLLSLAILSVLSFTEYEHQCDRYHRHHHHHQSSSVHKMKGMYSHTSKTDTSLVYFFLFVSSYRCFRLLYTRISKFNWRPLIHLSKQSKKRFPQQCKKRFPHPHPKVLVHFQSMFGRNQGPFRSGTPPIPPPSPPAG